MDKTPSTRQDKQHAHAHTPRQARPPPTHSLVVPEGGKDEVHLDEDGAEGEDARGGDDHAGVGVPGPEGDGPRHGVDPAGEVGLARPVPFGGVGGGGGGIVSD